MGNEFHATQRILSPKTLIKWSVLLTHFLFVAKIILPRCDSVQAEARARSRSKHQQEVEERRAQKQKHLEAKRTSPYLRENMCLRENVLCKFKRSIRFLLFSYNSRLFKFCIVGTVAFITEKSANPFFQPFLSLPTNVGSNIGSLERGTSPVPRFPSYPVPALTPRVHPRGDFLLHFESFTLLK